MCVVIINQRSFFINSYIGSKIINAEPMDSHEFNKQYKDIEPAEGTTPEAGYKVVYPDGYVSWSPKTVFETFYRKIDLGEVRLIRVSRVSEDHNSPMPEPDGAGMMD